MKIKRNQKGFTLIEVVLVLAIGGLIFLLAFLAFQQVSRNRRDTQRRSDAALMAANYNDVVTDAGGTIPDPATGRARWSFTVGTMTNLVPPSGGNNYQLLEDATAFTAPNQYKLYVGGAVAPAVPATDCAGNPMTSTRQGKIEMRLEGSIVPHCRSTQ